MKNRLTIRREEAGILARTVQRLYTGNRYIRSLVSGIPFVGGPIDVFITTERGREPLYQYFNKIDRAFLNLQSKRPVRGMLGTSIGDWPFLARGLDLPRDIQPQIMTAIERQEPGPVLMVILGEPGAGKTTLMRRIGMELAEKGRSVLELRPRMRTSPDWYPLVAGLRATVGGQPVIMIDDIFRCPGIEQLFADPELDCMILGSSRTNEDNTAAIRAGSSLTFLKINRREGDKLQWPTVPIPSVHELALLREREECQHYSDREWLELTTIEQGSEHVPVPLLVIMLQLSGGKPFDEIIDNAIVILRNQHPNTYKAFGIICAFHRLGLDTPTPLLARLMRDPHFASNLRADVVLERKSCGARGLIFAGDFAGHKESWQTAHELIAETAVQGEYSDFAEHVYEDCFNVSGELEPVEQLFLAWVLLSLARRGEKDLASRLLASVGQSWDTFASSKNGLIWATALDLLDDRNGVLRCLDVAEVDTVGSAFGMLSLLRKHAEPQKALVRSYQLVRDHPENAGVQFFHLIFIQDHGTQDEIIAALAEATHWLARHDKDSNVRTRYLGLVEAKGTPLQVAAALTDTPDWLARHDEDSSVRTRYLGLVEAKGTPPQVAAALTDTLDWLTRHEQDTVVRTRYLGLVEAKGSSQQLRAALAGTPDWLARHHEDNYVHTRYLALVESEGAPEQIAEAIDQAKKFLDARDEATDVRTKYLDLVDNHGTDEQVSIALQSTIEFLLHNKLDEAVLRNYLILSLRRGDNICHKQAIAVMKSLSKETREIKFFRDLHNLLLGRLDEFEQAAELKQWLEGGNLN